MSCILDPKQSINQQLFISVIFLIFWKDYNKSRDSLHGLLFLLKINQYRIKCREQSGAGSQLFTHQTQQSTFSKESVWWDWFSCVVIKILQHTLKTDDSTSLSRIIIYLHTNYALDRALPLSKMRKFNNQAEKRIYEQYSRGYNTNKLTSSVIYCPYPAFYKKTRFFSSLLNLDKSMVFFQLCQPRFYNKAIILIKHYYYWNNFV